MISSMTGIWMYLMNQMIDRHAERFLISEHRLLKYSIKFDESLVKNTQLWYLKLSNLVHLH